LTEDITFDNAPSPQNPPIYRDVLIHCRVSAEPRAEVSWRLRNRKLEPSTLSFSHPFIHSFFHSFKPLTDRTGQNKRYDLINVFELIHVFL